MTITSTGKVVRNVCAKASPLLAHRRVLVSPCGCRKQQGILSCEEHEALLAVQNGVNFRSTIQLNNSGFPPGPINSFHFAWTIVSRVLYPQGLLWTVRCISACIHALGSACDHALRIVITSTQCRL